MKDVPKAIEAVWKIESTRLIAAIARVTHDIGIAEELAQDALVTALELWPEEGIPENPGGRLMAAAERRAIDSLRRGRMLVQKHEEIACELEWQHQQLGPIGVTACQASGQPIRPYGSLPFEPIYDTNPLASLQSNLTRAIKSGILL